MPVGAMIFLGVVLALFAILDIYMLVSLSKPGDERNQIIVWKASSFTLLGVFGANILTVIEKIVTAQPLTQNPLVQLEVFCYYIFLYPSCITRESMVADMENIIRNRRKELGFISRRISKKMWRVTSNGQCNRK